MIKGSIRFKIIFTFSLTFTLFFIISGYFIYKNVSQTIIEASNKEMFARCEKIISKISLHPLILTFPDKNEKLQIDSITYNISKNLYRSSNFPPTKNFQSDNVYEQSGYRIAVLEGFTDDNSYEKIKVFLEFIAHIL